jgi:hypothetical protein
MSLKTATLDTGPTSYWPLDDAVGGSCHDALPGGGGQTAVKSWTTRLVACIRQLLELPRG